MQLSFFFLMSYLLHGSLSAPENSGRLRQPQDGVVASCVERLLHQHLAAAAAFITQREASQYLTLNLNMNLCRAALRLFLSGSGSGPSLPTTVLLGGA